MLALKKYTWEAGKNYYKAAGSIHILKLPNTYHKNLFSNNLFLRSTTASSVFRRPLLFDR